MDAASDPSLRRFASRVFRALPRFKGKTRAIRMVNRLFLLAGLPPSIVSRFGDGTLFRVDLRALTELIPHYLGSYEKERLALLKSFAGPGRVVVDVGANVGFFAVPLARDAERVYCFEPVPGNAARLRENLALNGARNVELIEAALSDAPGTLPISLREDFRDGSGTGNAAPWIGDAGDAGFARIEAPMTTLDLWAAGAGLTRLDLIKVDVEGHEDYFLRGARATIARFRPAILAEFNEDYFRRRGFDLDAFYREFAAEHDYQAYSSVKWPELVPLATLCGRKNTDDVLLLPR
jgi:FkbM family methyltransferase